LFVACINTKTGACSYRKVPATNKPNERPTDRPTVRPSAEAQSHASNSHRRRVCGGASEEHQQ